MELSTSQKGEIARLKVEQRAAEKGWISSRTVDYARYDLVLDDGQRLYKAQVKYASAESNRANGAVVANLRQNNADDRNTVFRRKKTRTYGENEIDAVLIYVPQAEKICWFGPECFCGKAFITIRLQPPGNGQRAGIKMISDFEW